MGEFFFKFWVGVAKLLKDQQDFGLVIIVINRAEYQERRKLVKILQIFIPKQVIMLKICKTEVTERV